jgi:hypothetical protein
MEKPAIQNSQNNLEKKNLDFQKLQKSHKSIHSRSGKRWEHWQ